MLHGMNQGISQAGGHRTLPAAGPQPSEGPQAPCCVGAAGETPGYAVKCGDRHPVADILSGPLPQTQDSSSLSLQPCKYTCLGGLRAVAKLELSVAAAAAGRFCGGLQDTQATLLYPLEPHAPIRSQSYPDVLQRPSGSRPGLQVEPVK